MLMYAVTIQANAQNNEDAKLDAKITSVIKKLTLTKK